MVLHAKFEAKLAKARKKLEKERKRLLADENSNEQPKQVLKKWKEKDKRYLYERVKERYVQMIRLCLNLIFIDPMRKIKLKQERLNKRRENL